MVKREQVEKWSSLAGSIALPLIGGILSSLPTPPAIKSGGWYTKIRKPKWTPPNWLFGNVWSVLYVFQGVASWLVWRKRDIKDVKLPLALYGAQLALNLAWNPIFFKFHRPDVATADAAAVLGVATAATVTMAQVAGNDQVLPLMVPYLGWVAFATVLSGVIAHKNPDADKIDGGSKPATTSTTYASAAKKA